MEIHKSSNETFAFAQINPHVLQRNSVFVTTKRFIEVNEWRNVIWGE